MTFKYPRGIEPKKLTRKPTPMFFKFTIIQTLNLSFRLVMKDEREITSSYSDYEIASPVELCSRVLSRPKRRDGMTKEY